MDEGYVRGTYQVHQCKAETAAEDHAPVGPAPPDDFQKAVQQPAHGVNQYQFRFHQLPVIAFPGLGILIRPAEYILEKRLDKARLNWYINRAKIK